MSSALQTISGEVISQALNDNFSYLDSGKANKVFVNVQNSIYGAVGDGVTDDTTAIQNAIDTMNEGEILIFPTGTYKITQKLSCTKNIIIYGCNSTIETSCAGAFEFTGTLKTTKTVTADYVETASKTALVLNNVTDIAIGDLINVKSTELYDTSKLYYFKGGNALVTGISGNNVYMNLVFPFDMTAASISVEIYNPIEVKIYDLQLSGQSNLTDTDYGIIIAYSKNSYIENIRTNKYKQNIQIKRSVNFKANIIETGNAKDSIADSWDGYGISIYSCTNVAIENAVTKSGQHGVTWGGQEVNFNISVRDSILKAEVWNIGLGAHENIYTVLISNCIVHGFLLAGNSTLENCTIVSTEVDERTNSMSCAESSRYANYIFKNVIFDSSNVYLDDYYQELCPTRKYVGNIIFENCKYNRLYLNVRKSSESVKIAEIDLIHFNDCDDFLFSDYDNVKKVIFENSRSSLDASIISNPIYGIAYGKINEIIIKNVSLAKRYNAIALKECDKIILNNLTDTGDEYGTESLDFTDITDLIIRDTDISDWTNRGVNFDTITKAQIINSSIRFYGGLAGASGTQACQEFWAKNYEDIDGSIFDIFTAPDGTKYKFYIDSAGSTATVAL